MRKQSEKQERDIEIYNVLAKDFLLDHPVCEACVTGCTYHATQVHHKKGRGRWLTVVEFFLAVCDHCHKWIEMNPKAAKEAGFSEPRTTSTTRKILYGKNKSTIQ